MGDVIGRSNRITITTEGSVPLSYSDNGSCNVYGDYNFTANSENLGVYFLE